MSRTGARVFGQILSPDEVDTFGAKRRNVKTAIAKAFVGTPLNYGQLAAAAVPAITGLTAPLANPYIIQHWDDKITVDPTAAAVALILPPMPELGEVHEICNVTTSANNIVVGTNSVVNNPFGFQIFGPGLAINFAQTTGAAYSNIRCEFMGQPGWQMIRLP